ncbi:MAG: hypothetical protein AAB434_03955 [Planctomycetota bacterium]
MAELDPFEAYRAKKKADKEKKDAAQPAPGPQPSEDGRPRGFASHRMDFDQRQDGAPPPAPPPAPLPKGFENGKLGKLGHLDPGQKPRGFGRDRLGPGPKRPPAPPDPPDKRPKDE